MARCTESHLLVTVPDGGQSSEANGRWRTTAIDQDGCVRGRPVSSRVLSEMRFKALVEDRLGLEGRLCLLQVTEERPQQSVVGIGKVRPMGRGPVPPNRRSVLTQPAQRAVYDVLSLLRLPQRLQEGPRDSPLSRPRAKAGCTGRVFAFFRCLSDYMLDASGMYLHAFCRPSRNYSNFEGVYTTPLE